MVQPTPNSGAFNTRRNHARPRFVTWKGDCMKTGLLCLGLGLILIAAPGAAMTPDGSPPSQETVCSGLSGAVFALCNAYCEAQDCDVHARPSCAQLRENLQKVTGSATFPCDPFCGDGNVDPGETCDGSDATACPGGCQADCTCPPPMCGNNIQEGTEACDGTDATLCPNDCLQDCTCAPICPLVVGDPTACTAFRDVFISLDCAVCCIADPSLACEGACLAASRQFTNCTDRTLNDECALQVVIAGCAAECCSPGP
jgi:hypothetical protein